MQEVNKPRFCSHVNQGQHAGLSDWSWLPYPSGMLFLDRRQTGLGGSMFFTACLEWEWQIQSCSETAHCNPEGKQKTDADVSPGIIQ